MGALSRVLNDEYRKSMELTYNIMLIFLAFSNFVEVPAHDQAPFCITAASLRFLEAKHRWYMFHDCVQWVADARPLGELPRGLHNPQGGGDGAQEGRTLVRYTARAEA